MAANKPGTPKGMRDFSPQEMVKRNYIFETIQHIFQRYGYTPIETPAMEKLSTLLGKYGDEGDKLLFKVLNSGDYLSKVDQAALQDASTTAVTSQIAEKGLRYDLTVPFARYVVQHQHALTFPFKRYQIQPVWRADKPQKGRYREFYQCDVDVIGSDGLLNEVELIQIIDEVFQALDLRVAVKVNNRKVLEGIAEYIGAADKFMALTVAIDKLDKIGVDKVLEELGSQDFSAEALEKLQPILAFSGTIDESVRYLKNLLATSEAGLKGVQELEEMLDYLEVLDLQCRIELDLTLARGLNYYTGAIFEVKALETEMGSICGGGRYDDLTGIFGLKDVSGVGVSFGADRIYDVMDALERFPSEIIASTKVLFVNFGKDEAQYILPLIQRLRKEGINSELYPKAAKMKKQMSYANAKAIPYVVIVGEEEMNTGDLSVKNMTTGEQQKIAFEPLIQSLKNM
ncbi:MAG: histidine--tRNA ligase [Bacteroidales bacterium]